MTVIDSIVSGKIFWRGKLVDASIAIDNGRIIDVGLEVNLPKAEKRYNFDGKIILPGLINVHVHLRDQDLSYKETFETGSMAAAAGGFTTVLDMPNNSPLTDSAYRLKDRIKLANGRIYINLGFYSLLPRSLNEIKDIVDLGAVGFKVYLNRPIGFIHPSDYEKLEFYLKVCGELNIPVVFHAEDYNLISSLEREYSSIKDFIGFLKSHPLEAEIKATSRILNLAKRVNCKIHLAHVTSGLIINLISKFKHLCTCEVTPHHLFLTKDVIKIIGGIGKMEPPLRSIFDVIYLWNCIWRGEVDVIADDHAPHSINEKIHDDFWNIKSGIPGLETTLPLMLNAVNNGLINLNDIVRLMSFNPSKIFHLNSKGSIEPGLDADLTIVDLNSEWIIDSSKFYSKAKFSPFDGLKVKGKVISTFVNGLMVYSDGEIICKGGKVIRSGIKLHS